MRKQQYQLCLLLALLPALLSARTIDEVKYTCPIDGQTFMAMTEMSGSLFGRQLDLKPIGAIGAPGHIPQCPRDHFVLYKDDAEFTQQEIEKLKPYILSDEYQALVKHHSKYYLAATTMQFIGEDKFSIAIFFLQASWEVDEDKTRYKDYARHALDAFMRYLDSSPEQDEHWATANLLVVELHRRTGEFGKAQALSTKLSSHKTFTQAGIYRHILETEVRLIQQKDDRAHDVPESRQ